MRIGYHPYKDQALEKTTYTHQIIIPVYIPNEEGYFKDAFQILNYCLQSLINTVHSQTYITIVNNGSSPKIVTYLNELFNQQKIHELIHTENIGKLNAIIKGLVGNEIELVTISDADVLFLPNWQSETTKIFNDVPKAGVVGIVPQFKMYENNCGNVIFDNLFNNNLKFIPVKNPNALIQFYDSIGWDRNYNQYYLEYNLGLVINSDLKVLIGSGHFVATYKKDMFQEIISYLSYKLGGNTEAYLDKAPLKKGYWRLSTHDNYAYHMGNTIEDWMKVPTKQENKLDHTYSNFKKNRKTNSVIYFIKNRLFIKFISIKWMAKLFLKWKGLPKEMIKKY